MESREVFVELSGFKTRKSFTALVCVAPTFLPACETPAHALEDAASDDKTRGADERIDSRGSVATCMPDGFASRDINADGEECHEVSLAEVASCLGDCRFPGVVLATRNVAVTSGGTRDVTPVAAQV